MATKKATAKTVTAKKTAATKKTAKACCARKPVSAPGVMKKGVKYSCNECGLVVSVDEICGCVEAHKLICCSKSMKAKK